MKEVARFYDPEEARIALGFLNAQGLEVFSADTGTLDLMPELRLGLGGYRLLAHEPDASQARALLAEVNQDATEKLSCPSCGQHRIVKERDIRFPMFHAVFMFVFPFAPQTGKLICLDCDTKWRPTNEENSDHEPEGSL